MYQQPPHVMTLLYDILDRTTEVRRVTLQAMIRRADRVHLSRAIESLTDILDDLRPDAGE